MSNMPPSDFPPPPSTPSYMPPDPRSQVAPPAYGLMATAGLGLLYQIVMLLLNLLGTSINAAAGEGGMFNLLSGGVGILFNFIAIATAGLVFFGALKMLKLQSYTLVMVATVIAMVPCISPCCLLGLPLGIWALVVLMKPEVKAAFTA